MFLEDPSRTHVLSAASVVELFESTNQPLVQPAGRAAQPAQAAVLAVDEGGALRVLIALTLIEAQENVIYASSDRYADAELSQGLEEAMLFAESMGFILDGTGWGQMDVSAREQLAGRLSAFRPPSGKEKLKVLETKVSADPLAQVARLFAAFAVLVCVSSLACSGPSAEQREKSAQIHYDLGTNLLGNRDAQGALAEYLQAEKDNPEMPEVHNALGLLYGFSLGRPAEAEAEFKRALELRPDDFSEGQNNYGAFLLSRQRFAEAIPYFEKAISNALYRDRAFAQCNLGWALYKTGQIDKAVLQLRTALQLAPRFCLGWKQLGIIFAEKNQLDDSFDAFSRYAESCPDVADASLQQSLVLSKLGKAPQAKAALDKCVELGKEKDPATASECRKQLRSLGSP